jgi:hypothetical protein
MSTYKKLNSRYTIDTNEVYITGNLVVQGVQTSVATENTTIKDTIITLNSGETLNGVGGGGGVSGIEIDRGSAGQNVVLIYDESVDRWAISNSSNIFGFISTTVSNVGFSLTQVSDDGSPELGGNLNTLSNRIFSSTTNVIIDDEIELKNTNITPVSVSGSTVVYAAPPDAGSCGLYVVNQSATNEELVTKRRAFGFSLIL